MLASRQVGGRRVPCWVFYLVVVLAIFAYGAFVRKSGLPDVLERPVTEYPAVQNLDGWAATHLLFWTLLGFWFPGHYLQALVVSLGWEGIEDYLGRTNIKVGGRRLQLIGHTDADCKYTGQDADTFWYGRYTTDTAYNLMGYIVGSALAGRFWPAGAA
jgi:hypothetical protein